MQKNVGSAHHVSWESLFARQTSSRDDVDVHLTNPPLEGSTPPQRYRPDVDKINMSKLIIQCECFFWISDLESEDVSGKWGHFGPSSPPQVATWGLRCGFWVEVKVRFRLDVKVRVRRVVMSSGSGQGIELPSQVRKYKHVCVFLCSYTSIFVSFLGLWQWGHFWKGTTLFRFT